METTRQSSEQSSPWTRRTSGPSVGQWTRHETVTPLPLLFSQLLSTVQQTPTLSFQSAPAVSPHPVFQMELVCSAFQSAPFHCPTNSYPFFSVSSCCQPPPRLSNGTCLFCFSVSSFPLSNKLLPFLFSQLLLSAPTPSFKWNLFVLLFSQLLSTVQQTPTLSFQSAPAVSPHPVFQMELVCSAFQSAPFHCPTNSYPFFSVSSCCQPPPRLSNGTCLFCFSVSSFPLSNKLLPFLFSQLLLSAPTPSFKWNLFVLLFSQLLSTVQQTPRSFLDSGKLLTEKQNHPVPFQMELVCSAFQSAPFHCPTNS